MKLKKIIIVLLVLLIGLIGIFIIVNRNDKENNNIVNEDNFISDDIDSRLKRVDDKNEFYEVKSCVEKFYTYYAIMFEESELNTEENSIEQGIDNELTQFVYDMLDNEYINARNISVNNILTKIGKINDSTVDITDMYVSKKSNAISVYIVCGKLRENLTGQISDFKIMLKLDSENKTFNVLLQDYIDEKYKEIKIGDDINIQVDKNIERNENNLYDSINISEEEYVTNLFNKYKEELIYNTELAYRKLDEEYRENKFESIDDFQNYTKNNIRKNLIMELAKYQITEEDGYTQYVCIDQYGDYYVFRETSIMNYTVLLDTYTIDLPEFLSKYNDATEPNKVLLNIQKVFQAINSGDYKYVYEKLDNDFKANYFKTQEDFKNYIKQNLYTNNKVSYTTYEQNGEVYIYNIQITDGNGENAGTINKKILMKLQEGTDFVMSFSVE